MKEIKLTQDKVAIVDDADFNFLNRFKWCVCRGKGNYYYAYRHKKMENGRQLFVLMHKEILNPPSEMETDHRDGNTLNNRRKNIRICTRTENQRNRKPNRNSRSAFKGVCWYKQTNRWLSRIYLNGKAKHLGYFMTEEEAAFAYDMAAKKLFGEFARINFKGINL